MNDGSIGLDDPVNDGPMNGGSNGGSNDGSVELDDPVNGGSIGLDDYALVEYIYICIG